jgi:hypothetical protein
MEIRSEPGDYLCQALRTARKWRIEDLRSDWLKRGRKRNGERYTRLPPGKYVELCRATDATTMFDFLYQLRIGAHYRSVDEYVEDVDDSLVSQFHEGLVHVMEMGLFAHEWLVSWVCGVERLGACLESWQNRVAGLGGWAVRPARERIAALAASPP